MGLVLDCNSVGLMWNNVSLYIHDEMLECMGLYTVYESN